MKLARNMKLINHIEQLGIIVECSKIKMDVMSEVLSNILVIHRENTKVSVSFRTEEKLSALKMDSVRKQLIKIICRRGTHLELDLAGIRFIDSDGFDTLNLIHRLGKKYRSTLTLKGVEVEVLEMIDLLKKYHVFHIQQIMPAC